MLKSRNQKGFTLIEIIAVLVILGILAAVAIPKYMDLQEDSRRAAANGAIAEVKARYSQAFGSYLLKNNGALPNTVGAILDDTNATSNLGDFTAGVSGTGGTTATISISAVRGTTLTTNASDSWTIPQ